MARVSEPINAVVSDGGFPMRPRLCGALCLFVAVSGLAALSAQGAKDVAGSRDHPMISRFDGAVITRFEQKEFDEYRLIRGVVTSLQPDGTEWGTKKALNDSNSVLLEGQVWRLTYDAPKNRSTLELIRSYETELAKSGFEILHKCAARECAGPPPEALKGRSLPLVYWYGAISSHMMGGAGYSVRFGAEPDQRYVAARLRRPTGDIYVAVLALRLDTPIVRLDVVEVKPMAGGVVKINAAKMATSITSEGSVTLYDILFDNDRADVKPESRPTISEIAALLKQNLKWELIVVGHTDKNGTLEHNLDLSLRRAQAVVAMLVSEFGIARNRLDARGVGFLAPIAPNATEADRAKNRRVQLVQR